MEIEFIGVGEAFEPSLGNTSILIKAKTNLMIDCGYAIPRNFFESEISHDQIDALYVTHFHADHCFGIPPILIRWIEDGRKKPFTIIGQIGTKQRILQIFDLAYPGVIEKFTYQLDFIESDSSLQFQELSLHFAETEHSVKNNAIRIDVPEHAVGFSGDGSFTDASKKLFQPCDILIHEAFRYEQTVKGHSTALEVIEFAETLPNLKTLAFVHLQRDERKNKMPSYEALKKQVPFRLMIPNSGDILTC